MPLPLPPGGFRAYLFDCDGTVADSMPLHYTTWRYALSPWGADFPEDLFYAWGGRTIDDVVEDLNLRSGLCMPAAEVHTRYEDHYRTLLPSLRAVPDVRAHIEEGYGRIPFAVVSGSGRASVVASLTTIGLLDRFETLVCAGDYVKPKPHPEGYLLAAARLGVAPADCLVFEDTDMGVDAAVSAGMAVVRVPRAGLR